MGGYTDDENDISIILRDAVRSHVKALLVRIIVQRVLCRPNACPTSRRSWLRHL